MSESSEGLTIASSELSSGGERHMPSTVTIAQFPDYSRLGPGMDMYREALTNAGIAVHRHHMYPRPNGGEPKLSARWIWQHRRKIQILHFHYFQRLYQSDRPYKTLFKYLGFTGKILLARLLGYRLTWTASNLYPHEPGMRLFDRFARWLVTYKAPVVFVELASAQEAIRQEFPWIHHIEEATHGHYIGFYPPGKPMSEARRDFDIPDDAFVFLYFGLIRAYKGVETLIETFTRHLAGPGCYLIVAGDPHTPAVRRRIEHLVAQSLYVRLELGHVPNERVETVFNACNVAVFPFIEIFQSGTALLACSLKRAIIVPQRGALPFSEAGGFFRYDPSDPDGLCKAMRASMQADWAAEGMKAYATVRERSWNEAGRRMAQAFERIVHSQG